MTVAVPIREELFGMRGVDDVEKRFGLHAQGDQTDRLHQELRFLFKQMGDTLDTLLPTGRAKSVAMTELQATSLWSHQAVEEQLPLIQE